MINVRRWLRGAAESQLSLADYRHYVISHEVGHALGHGHVGCPGPGTVGPVMLQQTKGLDGCARTPGRFPTADRARTPRTRRGDPPGTDGTATGWGSGSADGGLDGGHGAGDGVGVVAVGGHVER